MDRKKGLLNELNCKVSQSCGLRASSCRHALFLWELEKMDPTAGRFLIYFVTTCRPSPMHLGTPEVKGQF